MSRINYPTNLPYVGEVFCCSQPAAKAIGRPRSFTLASTVQLMGLCSMTRKRDSAFMSLCTTLRCHLPPAAQRTMSCGCGWVAVTQLGVYQDLLKEDAALMCCPGSGAGPRRWVRCGVSGGFFRPLFDRTKSGHSPNRISYSIKPAWEKGEFGRFKKPVSLPSSALRADLR